MLIASFSDRLNAGDFWRRWRAIGRRGGEGSGEKGNEEKGGEGRGKEGRRRQVEEGEWRTGVEWETEKKKKGRNENEENSNSNSNTVFIKDCDKRTNYTEQNKKLNRIIIGYEYVKRSK